MPVGIRDVSAKGFLSSWKGYGKTCGMEQQWVDKVGLLNIYCPFERRSWFLNILGDGVSTSSPLSSRGMIYTDVIRRTPTSMNHVSLLSF